MKRLPFFFAVLVLVPCSLGEGQDSKKELLPPEAIWKWTGGEKVDGKWKKPEIQRWHLSVADNHITGYMIQDGKKVKGLQVTGGITPGKVPIVTLKEVGKGKENFVNHYLGKIVKGRIVGRSLDNDGDWSEFELTVEKK